MDTESHSVERIFLGIGHILLAMFFLLVYVIVLLVISKSPELSGLSSYKLMMLLGLFHCIPLVIESITGIVLTANIRISNTFLEQLLGAVSSSSYKCSVFMNLVLAWNRVQILCFLSQSTRTFFISIVTTACVIFMCLVAMDMRPGEGQYLDYHKYQWYYGHTSQYNVLYEVTTDLQLISLAAATAIYLSILSYLVYKKHSLQQSDIACKIEMRIFIQCVLLNSLNAIIVCFYNYGIKYVENRYDGVISNTIYIFVNGINSVLYMLFVKSIRAEFITMVTRTRTTSKVHQIQMS
ncbi:hypothetical protein QR680_010072 [Steinernema hermaphroditum]|uniref:7TM GPCR serpentine receptor class x (Srx) domain-containing protein n=1 Tax=Steinernema hermaphroditum TaxID=289476 RepID=A0AA39IPA4_9BILA|nr:hypothetical protein QR680_010072 [Steinernema hermaphroditum]